MLFEIQSAGLNRRLPQLLLRNPSTLADKSSRPFPLQTLEVFPLEIEQLCGSETRSDEHVHNSIILKAFKRPVGPELLEEELGLLRLQSCLGTVATLGLIELFDELFWHPPE